MQCTDCGKEVEIKKKESGVSTWRCTCGAYGIYGKRSKRDGGTEAQAGTEGTGQTAAPESAPAPTIETPPDPAPAGAGTDPAAASEPDRGSEVPWYDRNIVDLIGDLID